MQSLGKIALRAPAVGAETWCSVTLRGRRAVGLRVTYFEQVLCRGLWVDFDDAYTVPILVARWRHNFREIAI